MTRSLNPQKLLEEADDKVQHGVAYLVPRDVSGQNTAAGNFSVTTRVIPNELLKPVRQLGNKAIGATSQSTHNLLKLSTKPGARTFNFTKKILDFLREGIGRSIITTNLPILARNPEDPVDGLLQVGGARGKGYSHLPSRQTDVTLTSGNIEQLRRYGLHFGHVAIYITWRADHATTRVFKALIKALRFGSRKFLPSHRAA
ncbi:ribosomal protein S2 [Babesia caballi]|uniref:Ribosomal protein S2 n=1 Tax=Babesia caballi TaxID=5871 RepID=A0AAV4LTA2_BABCB|nr:ribosomal protein S2 [Babesia caballi]